jgi:ferrochelatase
MADAVLLMAYGTPARPEDVEAYYTDIRRGRPPTPEQLADLRRRYDAIGGVSPLAERTQAQRAALQRALGDDVEVVLGFKHVAPFIEDAMASIAALPDVRRVVALVLAPHYSALSVGEYLERARAAGSCEVIGIPSWATEPAYVAFLARAVDAGLAGMPEGTKVLFTAHSLPARVEAMGDPYADELRATAKAVAEAAGLTPWAQWATAWQSAGRTPEPWLGPDVATVIDELGATGRGTGVLVCPCGFVADHLEVLYDLDVEARARAEAAGLAFARTPVVNDDPAVFDALAGRVRAALAGAGGGE